MPNRIIKESIRTSKGINSLSDFDFRVWTYLITYVDDYGRGSADPELLKSFLFPRRSSLTETQIKKSLSTLAEADLINLYSVDDEAYLFFPKWDKHQTIRNKRSKFPEPTNICNQMFSTCNQEKANESKCSRNPIQSNPKQNPNPNTNICASNDARSNELSIEDEFNQLWSLHPKKRGDKETALKNYKKARKAGTTFEEVKSGLENYIEYIKREKPESHYILLAATWFNQNRWTDDYSSSAFRKPTLMDIAPTLDISGF